MIERSPAAAMTTSGGEAARTSADLPAPDQPRQGGGPVKAAEVRLLKREGNTVALIYDKLRTDILNGQLTPGSPLSQLAIAKAHGTSNGPVREAMRRLQQDQLVVASANRRFNVAPFDLSDLESVLGLHLVNVALVIRIGTSFLTDADVRALDRYVADMERAVGQDDVAWEAAYRDFVLVIARHAGMRMVSVIGNFIDNIQRYRSNLLDRFPRVYAGGPAFRQIQTAVARRDGVAAAALYAEFFGRISLSILAGAAPNYDAARLRVCISAAMPHDGADDVGRAAVSSRRRARPGR